MHERRGKLEVLNKELGNIKKSIRNKKYNNGNEKYTKRINKRLNNTEEWISKLENTVVEITEAEAKKKKKRNEDNSRDLWDNIKRTNIHIIGVPEA